ncbi:MAG: tRNA (adenosine(37)-N6)-threonylcarbamoyltransferase complex dimerization subunit type 1 TsaB [Acidobacteria bacterium]|nr:tRNA (adenosine(37)-N6)-threonylcarbamoyltransferase complex dimerization subunit type 1 TsaB [Acidobacteriota bacterium]
MTVSSPPDSPVLLILDTTSTQFSVALVRGSQLLAEFGVVTRQTSSLVISDIDFVLHRAGCAVTELDGFGVLVGPGSFTGLRVGLATIQAMSQALNRPVVTATTLEALTTAVPSFSTPVWAWVVQISYRDEVYAQCFRLESGTGPQPLTEPVAGHKNQIAEIVTVFLRTPPTFAAAGFFTGDAIPTLSGRLQSEADKQHVQFFPLDQASQMNYLIESGGWYCIQSPTFLAPTAARLFLNRWREGKQIGAHEIDACYVRPSEAELKLIQPVESQA